VEEGDGRLRQAGEELTENALLRKWLTERGSIRAVVAAVALVAEGKSPKSVLSFLSPHGEFKVKQKKRHLYPAEKSYARYDFVARAVTSVDPVKLGDKVRSLGPYLDAAYAEIAPPTQSFTDTLKRALHTLLETPQPKTAPELRLKGAIYQYKDPTLEGLNGAQKQLLRMGPKNDEAILGWLGKLDQALAKPDAAPAKPDAGL
jgi:hypothetical protein